MGGRPCTETEWQSACHAAGGELRWTRGVTLSGHAGRTFTLGGASAAGWLAGGGIDWRAGSWTLSARADWRDELYYQVTRGWLAIGGSL